MDELPPTTEVGLRLTDEMVGAVIVRFAVAEVLFAVAVIVAVVLDATGTVVTVNVAVLDPAATVTVAGTVAALALLLNETE